MMRKIWNQYSYAIFLMILTCSLALIISLHLDTSDSEKFVTITVSEGDSLWEISSRFSEQHSLSNQKFVKWVKQYNNIDGDQIYPGDELTIPVSKNYSFSSELASAVEE